MLPKIRYSVLAILTLVMAFSAIGPAAAQGEERPLRGRRGLRGEITAIEDDTLTLELGSGGAPASIRIIVNDEETRFHIIGQEEVSLDDFSVGDTVLARGQRQDDGSLIAALILRQPEGDYVMGRVAAIEEDGLQLNGRDGQTITVNVSPDAIVAMRGQELTWGDPAGQEALQEGLVIIAFGALSEDGLTLDAHTLASQRPQRQQRRGLAGTIEAIDGDSFTMTTLRGDEVTVLVTEETRYRLPGTAEPGLDDFAAGDDILIFGHLEEEGQVTARILAAMPENRPPGRPVVGEINGIDGAEISLTTLGGASFTIATDSDTIYRIGRDNEAALDGFASGDKVAVFGKRGEEDGTLLATHVMKRK